MLRAAQREWFMFLCQDDRQTVSIERSVVLWCIRVWVLGQRREIGAAWRIQEALERVGAPGAAPALGAYMRAIEDGALRPIDVQCTCWRGVREDEHALLDVVALAQALRPFEAMLVLRGLAGPQAACAALAQAQAVAATLTCAGWQLDAPSPCMRHVALGSGRVHGGRAPSLPALSTIWPPRCAHD
jgi:hypothetical protein